MLNFFEMNQLVNNDKVVKEWLEAVTGQETAEELPFIRVPRTRSQISTSMQQLPANDRKFRSDRGRGKLRPDDPINQYTNVDGQDINIVWITGMWSGAVPGTGRYAELLKPLGYNLRIVKTLSDLKSAALGRLVRHWPFSMLSGTHKGWADAHVARNQEKVTKELGEDTTPDLIIGSSQGGAIALSIAPRYTDIPMILLCPAWKIFRVTPTYVHPESVIIHGVRDMEVPFEDSQELAEMFEGIRLIPTNDGHIMQEGLTILIRMLQSMTGLLSKRKREREIEAQKGRDAASVAQESVYIPQVNIWFA
jgi:hypothetical protein